MFPKYTVIPIYRKNTGKQLLVFYRNRMKRNKTIILNMNENAGC